MAFCIVLKRLASSSLITRSVRTISPTVTFPSSRFISTKVVEDFFTGSYDPFKSTNQVPYLKDQITNNKGIRASETPEGLTFRVEMPGLRRGDVRVYLAEQDNLVIKGKKQGVPEEYNYTVGIPKESIGGIRAEMNNGVLEVLVPRVRERDRAVGYDMEMTDEALYFRINHTSLEKEGWKVEGVKLALEQNTLIVNTLVVGVEGAKKDFIGRFDLPETKKKYDAHEIKSKIMNGRLMVVVPLVNE